MDPLILGYLMCASLTWLTYIEFIFIYTGTQPDGSLSLLGQYSDDGLVEEENETAKSTDGGIASDACITKVTIQ